MSDGTGESTRDDFDGSESDGCEGIDGKDFRVSQSGMAERIMSWPGEVINEKEGGGSDCGGQLGLWVGLGAAGVSQSPML